MSVILFEAGMRLDKALVRANPQWSLRTARRMIQDEQILVNDVPAAPGYRLHSTDRVSAKAIPSQAAPQAKFVGQRGSYLFFYKPPGLHTARLAGRDSPSLEAQLPAITSPGNAQNCEFLLQRLDFPTCGIIAAAQNRDAYLRFRQMEKAGQVRKFYLAFLSGELSAPMVAKFALDTNGGKRVKIMQNQAEALRWTFFEPLACRNGVTLTRCMIRCGQRHQIRAHAAAIGFPLTGDELYEGDPQIPFALEHYALCSPEITFKYRDEYSPVLANWDSPLPERVLCM